MSCTIVTAYYRVPSKYPNAQYRVWIHNFMTNLPSMQCVVYTNQETYKSVFADRYPETDKRKYRFVELEDFVVSKYDWKYDYAIDHEKNVGHSPELYKIWAEKSFFLQRAMKENIYGTDYFFWNDIGLFRTAEVFPTYPNVSILHPSKLHIVQVAPFTVDVITSFAEDVDKRFHDVWFIAGGSFGGHKDVCQRWIELYAEMLDIFAAKNLFKGKDQILYLWIIVKNPSLFRFVTTPCYNKLFAMNYFLSGGNGV